MRGFVTIAAMTVALTLAACGKSEGPEKKQEPMKVEDTVFGPLVGTPEKVEDRVDDAVELHRENLDRRLAEDEGASPDEERAGD